MLNTAITMSVKHKQEPANSRNRQRQLNTLFLVKKKMTKILQLKLSSYFLAGWHTNLRYLRNDIYVACYSQKDPLSNLDVNIQWIAIKIKNRK